MPLQTYLFCPRLNDLDRSKGRVAIPTVNDRWRRNFLSSIASRWLDAQLSAVQALIHQTERATRLAALQPLEPKGDALRRTRRQHSACWALGSARWGAVLEDTERRSTRVCIAVAKIRQAGSQLPSLGTRLFAFAQAEPMCSPKNGIPSCRHGWFGRISPTATMRPRMRGSLRAHR
jgi:hypothetical protein